MCRVISVANQKGRVGKTIPCVNLTGDCKTHPKFLSLTEDFWIKRDVREVVICYTDEKGYSVNDIAEIILENLFRKMLRGDLFIPI